MRLYAYVHSEYSVPVVKGLPSIRQGIRHSFDSRLYRLFKH